jgi:septum formation protein
MLLERLHLPFISIGPGTDETPLPGEAPAATAFRLAEAKARSAAAAHPTALIIGSDQVADCSGPRHWQTGNARKRGAAAHGALGSDRRLPQRALPSRRRFGRCQTALVDVRSTFRFLSADDIEAYLRRERPYDCTGSVRSEALGISLFESIESDDPTALIGLPLIRLTTMLRAAGLAVPPRE